jgi:hypothetical protein
MTGGRSGPPHRPNPTGMVGEKLASAAFDKSLGRKSVRGSTPAVRINQSMTCGNTIGFIKS